MSDKVENVKAHVLIPDYFDKVIIPEMKDYYSDYTVNFHNRPVVKCPLHGEDTPSLRWYEETNTFYCFGCRAGGDVINLHRLFINSINGSTPSFNESVDYLYKAFIQGKETKAVVNNHTEDRAKSTNVEVMRLMNYIDNLEKTLKLNYTEQNKIYYSLIDNIKLLCSLNLINATDGLNYIKGEIQCGVR